MDCIYSVVFTLMLNPVNLVGTGEDAALSITNHGVVFSASFPQLVHDLHVLLTDSVTQVMAGLCI